MSCKNNAKIESLDIILDNLAGCTRINPEEWLDINAWSIKEWITS